MEEGVRRNSVISKKVGRGMEEDGVKGVTKTTLEAMTTEKGPFMVQKIPSNSRRTGLRSLSRCQGKG